MDGLIAIFLLLVGICTATHYIAAAMEPTYGFPKWHHDLAFWVSIACFVGFGGIVF